MTVQWATVLVLFGLLGAVNHFKPEWTSVVVGVRPTGKPTQDSGVYDAIDGDSFRAGKVEIRLHGIDAPEYGQSCADLSRKKVPCGKMAREQLSRLIRGKSVNCTIVDRDRYRRQVSVCRDGTLDINREMVRLGWAVAYRRHALAYVGAEREAKAARRGIWAWVFEMPEEYRARNRADSD